ncbi:MAG: signal peptidase I [Spirochaetota bacterium]
MLPRSSRRYETYREHESILRRGRRVLGFLVLLFLVYQLVTVVIVRPISIESVAMEPTLEYGDRLLAVPLIYGPNLPLFRWVLPGFGSPRRGDLALVKPGYAPDLGLAARLGDPFVRFFTLENRRLDDGAAWDSSRQVKRIVGLPGDTVRLERFVAYVRPPGETEFVSEFALAATAYEVVAGERPGVWQPLDPFGAAYEEITLGAAEYFVLSDNHTRGIDSRHWGALARERVLARVTLRFWPFARFGRP